jgi:predicted DNA-binding transcriptional regulator YafY
VRKEQAYSLRSKYLVKEFDSEWDLMSIPYSYEPEMIEILLWHGQNIIVKNPQSLRNSIVSRLEEFING